MTLELRKQSPKDRIEGREPPPDWSDDDYAVVDEKLGGQIYSQQVQGDIKWCVSRRRCRPRYQTRVSPTRWEEARGALAARY
jgi:hypothetical protein